MTLLKVLAPAATVAIYALIVLGFVVRITGSGMGCGDDWPLCNGRLIPNLSDWTTVLEWSHRLAALAVSLLVFGFLGAAVLSRREQQAAPTGRDFTKVSLLAASLLVVQVFLGAVTVWLELPAASVILHLAAALALLATLVVASLAAWSAGAHAGSSQSSTLRVYTAGALGALTLLLGGFTANLDAGVACRGFPLCNGELWPSSSPSAVVHWIHRLAAYAFVVSVTSLSFRAFRERSNDRPAVATVAALTLLQVVVAVVMVTGPFALWWRSLHAALGTGIWVALVWLAWETGRLRSATQRTR